MLQYCLPVADAALRLVDRHQQRRRQGVPTLTVVAAWHGDASHLIRRWGAEAPVPVCEAPSGELAGVVAAWLATLADARNVTAAAYGWLAQRAGREVEKPSSGLAARSPHEQTLFLDRTLGVNATAPADIACRAVLEHACQRGSTASGLWDRLRTAFDGDLAALVRGMLELFDQQPIPIVWIPFGSRDASELRVLLDGLAALVSASPALPVVLSIDPPRLDEYLAGAHECRALALVREGLIESAPAAAGAAATPNAAEAVLADDRAAAAARLDDDPARSAAERYLYERLQSMPETTGLFELNGRLDSPGGRAMEIDLLARDARVAVEIDGYYHFTDLEAYRRDRRKDALLQHQGYFVVRCLADDVASRLEEILETIIAAVRRPRR